MTASPPSSPSPDPAGGPSPEPLAQELGWAASGRMPIGDLLARAEAWGRRGQPEAAAALYGQWVRASDSPHRHVASFNHGTVLEALGRLAEAEQAYRQALRHRPDFAQALINLGHLCERQDRAADALAEWQSAIDLTAPPGRADWHPLHCHALNSSARLHEVLGRFAEAESLLRRSLVLQPGQPEVMQHLVHLRQKQCRWPLHEPVGPVTAAQLAAQTPPLALLAVTDDPALQLAAARRFVEGRGWGHALADAQAPYHLGGPLRSGRIRIGYLSGDLCLHAVGLLTAELLERHDRSRFEVHAFCWSPEDGTPLRARLRAAMDRFVPLAGLDDEAAARCIAAHGIDVLVDLQGLTAGARPAILARRPAPVQVGYLGFPGTTALPGVDWVVGDPFMMPPALEPFCTERALRVPCCFQVSDRLREVGPVPRREEVGLPPGGFVFCAFNNSFKLTEAMFGRWMRILEQVSGSVLWLLGDPPEVQANLLAAARAHGVDPARLVFAPRVTPPAYLARMRLGDLFLDTFPYNGGTTVSDALWMGLPVLTLAGRSPASRMAGSLLTQVGLPELVTTTPEDYERLAVAIGGDAERAAALRRHLELQGRQSPLFDVPARVRELEAVFASLALAQRGR